MATVDKGGTVSYSVGAIRENTEQRAMGEEYVAKGAVIFLSFTR